MISCKKDNISQVEQSLNQRPKVDNGYEEMMGLSQLNKIYKDNFIDSSYRYYVSKDSNKLWIFQVKPNTNGFQKAKILVYKEKNATNVAIFNFTNISSSYKNGDFKTYSGTITA